MTLKGMIESSPLLSATALVATAAVILADVPLPFLQGAHDTLQGHGILVPLLMACGTAAGVVLWPRRPVPRGMVDMAGLVALWGRRRP